MRNTGRVVLVSGVDIIEIPRVRRVAERYGQRFLERIYTEEEIGYCRGRAPQLASRFAAKEALFKAIGTGWTEGITWLDAEVCNQPNGKPKLMLSGRALEEATQLGVIKIWISLTHTNRYAAAQVILER